MKDPNKVFSEAEPRLWRGGVSKAGTESPLFFFSADLFFFRAGILPTPFATPFATAESYGENQQQL